MDLGTKSLEQIAARAQCAACAEARTSGSPGSRCVLHGGEPRSVKEIEQREEQDTLMRHLLASLS